MGELERDEEGRVLHMYHCPLDGNRLFEIALGMVQCPKCNTQFIPTGDPEWEEQHPGQRMDMLSWIVETKEEIL